jgi:hypothetical protein
VTSTLNVGVDAEDEDESGCRTISIAPRTGGGRKKMCIQAYLHTRRLVYLQRSVQREIGLLVNMELDI